MNIDDEPVELHHDMNWTLRNETQVRIDEMRSTLNRVMLTFPNNQYKLCPMTRPGTCEFSTGSFDISVTSDNKAWELYWEATSINAVRYQ